MLNEDIKLAISFITGNFERGSMNIYPFTNEDIKGYFDNFDFKGKDVLSVLASSDQVFDMFLRGAKSIDTFDINPLTKYYFYLKKAAILALDKKDFINFFNQNIISDNEYEITIDNYNKFNKDIFMEISKYLKGDSYIFWNTLFENFSPVEISKERFLFSFDYHNEWNLKIKTLYYNNYYKLKARIGDLKITFTKCDVKDLPEKLNSKYDIIYLSNTIFYAFAGYRYNLQNAKIVKDFLDSLALKINNQGVILADYLYDWPFVEDLVITKFEKIKTLNFHNDYALIYRK